MKTVRWILLPAMACMAGLAVQAAPVHSLEAFGDISTPERAEAALQVGIHALMEKGGGVLVVPSEAPAKMRIVNNSQTDRNGHAVTIVDLRKGFIDVHLPAMGKQQTAAWGGMRLQRTVNLVPQKSRIPFQGVYPAQSIQNYVVSGTSSYMATLTRPVKKGKDQRFYVDLIRGIYPGQYLTVTSSPVGYAPPYDRILVKSIGWDDKAKRNYFVADLEYDHAVGSLVYNKHVVNGLQIEGNSNGDNQTMEFQVTRRVYGVGDSFGISSAMYYMSDIFSGFGDEGGVVINSETIGVLDSFHSTIETVDWSKDEVTYAAGKCMANTLSSSRPLINMNRKKWITSGRVNIVNAGGSWKGKSYPGRIGGPANVFNYQGGAIIGSSDCGWTRDIIGRFFAVMEPSEVLTPGDSSTAGGYARLPNRPVYRWYRIMDLESFPDGTQRIRILRVRWSAVAAGAPKLFRDDNYTSDGHEVPLQYAIAPGAWVYDISRGWADVLTTGGYVSEEHPRKLKLVPHRDRGTSFDFEVGDPVEQAVGPDPWHPVPFRIRQFDQLPTTMNGSSIQVLQYGRVQVPSAIDIAGITRTRSDLERRKDRKPSYDTLLSFRVLSKTGIRFQSGVMESAILFDQPEGQPQPMRWRRTDGGTSSLTVQPGGPNRGDFIFAGGDMNLNGESAKRVAGISATPTPSNNLRGINVKVKSGATSVDLQFPSPEPDAAYSVTVQPNWFTMDRVIKKAAEGFTVEFSQPAAEGASLDWQLIR